jgi:hypothetical protein
LGEGEKISSKENEMLEAQFSEEEIRKKPFLILILKGLQAPMVFPFSSTKKFGQL